MFSLGFHRKAKDVSFEVCGVPLERAPLLRLLKKAQRNGVVFKCLNFGEYMFLKLVIKTVNRVRSFILAKALSPIIKRLLEALKNTPKLMMEILGRVSYWMMVKGLEKAKEISRLALKWGNKEAHKWAEDTGFARYLTIMNMHFWENEGSFKAY